MKTKQDESYVGNTENFVFLEIVLFIDLNAFF